MSLSPLSLSSAASLRKIIQLLAVGWVLVVGLALAATLAFDWNHSLDLARIVARASYEKDLIYRRWASLHGGVYVPPTEKTPPNPYLTEVPERDVVTTGGKALTLMNPAYMTRQVYEMSVEAGGVRSRITSLRPIRKGNSPDEWEAAALRSFERGVREASTRVTVEGVEFFRYMRPMLVEESCLKCHGDQGYRVGDIRGGISVSVPLAPYIQAARGHMTTTAAMYVLIGGLGLVGLWLGGRRLEARARAQQAAEVALVESERRLRELMENVQLIGVVLNLQGNVDFANDFLLRLTGWRREEVLGQSWFDRFIPADADVRRLFVESMASGSLPVYYENEILTRDGKRRLIAWSNSLLRDENGKVKGAASIGEDITERRRAETTLREQAALLDVAPDAIIQIDLQGVVRFWNRGADLMYGWTAAEAIGRPLQSLVYDDARPLPVESRKALLAKGEWRGELNQRNKSGADVVVRALGVLMRDAEGKPRSILLTATNIAAEKALEAELARGRRLECMGAIASGVAHDLNNVLTPILMATEMLRPLAKTSEDREVVNLMGDSARRGADIVQQLLLFSRGSEAPRMRVEVGAVMRELERLMQETFPKNLSVEVRVPSDLWAIEADRTGLQQILLNLCVNARDAMPKGGALSLTAENVQVDEFFAGTFVGARPGPHVALRVSDTGAGIPRELLGKIFDPFFTTKPVGQGTGLGLSSVLGITRSHGGFVRVESEPGRGTTFVVFLPAIPGVPSIPADQTASPPAAAGKGELVLVVDDEGSVRSVVERALVAANYRVVVAVNGAEALAEYTRHAGAIQLVITDMMMPVMDGLQLLHALRQLAPRLPALAMSGGGVDLQPELQRNFGPQVRFLAKPFLTQSVLQITRELLDGSLPPA